MPPTPASFLAQLERIEARMKRIGQWLQFIFIPNVRAAAEQNKFLASSHVGAQAEREFDTVPEASQLASLLADFDKLF